MFVTAGEAGEDASYWGSLEDGIRATYAQMAGVRLLFSGMLLQSAGDPLAEQQFGLANQLAFHVREDTVEIECDAQRHRLGRYEELTTPSLGRHGRSRDETFDVIGADLVQFSRSQQVRTLERGRSDRVMVDEVESGVRPPAPAALMAAEGHAAREAFSPGFPDVA